MRPKLALISDPSQIRTDLDALKREVERLGAELTELRAHAALLESLAQEDPLTGLLNRRGLFRDLARAIAYRARYGTPIALLVGDLDAFKGINDRHGHEAGDRALVARLGGDEFAVLLWQVTEDSALQKARSLEMLVGGMPLSVDTGAVFLGLSFGMTLLAPDDTAEEAIARADGAMYRRKEARRVGQG
jgi:GGDEF domain-containing protein